MIFYTNHTELRMKSDIGTWVGIMAIASTPGEANAVMAANEGTSLLTERDGLCYVAFSDDLGIELKEKRK